MWKWLVPILISLAAPTLAERPVFGPPPARGVPLMKPLHEAAALLNPARSNGADVKLARAGGR